MSNVWIVTKRKKLVPTFLHHMNDHSSFRRNFVGATYDVNIRLV